MAKSQCYDFVVNNSSKCNMYCINTQSTLGWVTLTLLEITNQILPTAGISQS